MKHLFIILFLFTSFPFLTQASTSKDSATKNPIGTITVGILQGGGSIVGFDMELGIYKNLAVQAGAGIFGYGAAINFHFKPYLRSSFIALTYWHQGIGATYAQTLIGPTFIYRYKKLFTAQLGLGHPIDESADNLERFKEKGWDVPPLELLYSIGLYFPLYSE